MAVNVLIAETIHQAGIDRLRGEPGIVMHIMPDTAGPEELAERLARCRYEALIVRSKTKVTGELLAKAPHLKVVGRAGVGVDNIDVPAATRRGILVVNAPGANTTSTAEHTIAMMLALARRIPAACGSMKAGRWQRQQFMGTQLAGKTLGILGLGRIGREVAKRAAALGMNLLGYDPLLTPDMAHRLGVVLSSVDEICSQADFITVHTPLTAKTKGLIDRDKFAGMKKGIYIINCARGGIIDEEALLEALNDGRVAGAALDVMVHEPPPANHPLVNHPNVVVTPHLGASTEEAQADAAVEVAEAVLAALDGRPVRSAVNGPYLRGLLQDKKGYLDLCERLGALFTNLYNGGYHHLEITYAGEAAEIDSEAMTTILLKGLLAPLTPEVNYINAGLLAEERGFVIRESKSSKSAGYTNLVMIRASVDDVDSAGFGAASSESAAGSGGAAGAADLPAIRTLAAHLTAEGKRRLTDIDGYSLHVEEQGMMIIARNQDKPGMIGKVGTVLGRHGINISFMQVGRKRIGDLAVMVIGIDQPLTAEALSDLRSLPDLYDVRVAAW
ncbi:MAG TPA: phosphoglycerate dehydrogenase [Firmicutes bacterium]|nr:phosphoglycerate dehydrogenase [Bacillota bacterium]